VKARRRRAWRPPTRVALPGGFVVPIVYRSHARVNALRLGRVSRGRTRCGYWDGERIVVNRDVPLWVQVEVIGHELLHAVHDYSLWLRDRYVDAMKEEAGAEVLERWREEG